MRLPVFFMSTGPGLWPFVMKLRVFEDRELRTNHGRTSDEDEW